MSHITNTVSQILSNRKFRSELNEQPFEGQEKSPSGSLDMETAIASRDGQRDNSRSS